MFLSLLAVTFLVALMVCFIVAGIFAKPIDGILARIVDDSIAYAWAKYLRFAIFVVGISGGVRVYSLEDFLKQPTEDYTPPTLDVNSWVLEIYRTIIGSLESIAWMLLLFYLFALIAYVIVHICERKAKKHSGVDKE